MRCSPAVAATSASYTAPPTTPLSGNSSRKRRYPWTLSRRNGPWKPRLQERGDDVAGRAMRRRKPVSRPSRSRAHSAPRGGRRRRERASRPRAPRAMRRTRRRRGCCRLPSTPNALHRLAHLLRGQRREARSAAPRPRPSRVSAGSSASRRFPARTRSSAAPASHFTGLQPGPPHASAPYGRPRPWMLSWQEICRKYGSGRRFPPVVRRHRSTSGAFGVWARRARRRQQASPRRSRTAASSAGASPARAAPARRPPARCATRRGGTGGAAPGRPCG